MNLFFAGWIWTIDQQNMRLITNSKKKKEEDNLRFEETWISGSASAPN